ncbi:MAG: glycosyltransferase family 4 protein [Candidatus Parcubacteria bacterium]|nr:glycosyltransferase family 4 protein [Candidatus Parcubacteria bacterium]
MDSQIIQKQAKVFSTFHSDDRNHKKWGLIARKFLGLGAYISVRWPDKTIAVSKYQSKTHGQEFNGELEYIPNGVPAFTKVSPQLITEKWGLAGNDYILAVSRLIKHKGLHYLIRAYSILKNVDKKLVIVGDANYTDNYVQYLKNLAGDNKNIIFTGNQTNQTLAELYSNAYLFVQPSEAEGLSIALLEAMSYGKAVICSDIEPNKEAVADLALTFRNKSICDLSQKLRYLLDHPEIVNAMGIKLQERARIEYNWENIAKRTIALYESVRLEAIATKAIQTVEA